MRTDYKLDDVRVICPNASLIGYGTRIMKRGKCFTFANDADGGGYRFVARSLGRVNAGTAQGDRVENHIFAIVLSSDLSSAFVRWVDPLCVTQIFDPPSKLAAFFLAPDLPYDPQTMVRLIEHGTMSERFIENAPERVAQWHGDRVRSC